MQNITCHKPYLIEYLAQHITACQTHSAIIIVIRAYQSISNFYNGLCSYCHC